MSKVKIVTLTDDFNPTMKVFNKRDIEDILSYIQALIEEDIIGSIDIHIREE